MLSVCEALLARFKRVQRGDRCHPSLFLPLLNTKEKSFTLFAPSVEPADVAETFTLEGRREAFGRLSMNTVESISPRVEASLRSLALLLVMALLLAPLSSQGAVRACNMPKGDMVSCQGCCGSVKCCASCTHSETPPLNATSQNRQDVWHDNLLAAPVAIPAFFGPLPTVQENHSPFRTSPPVRAFASSAQLCIRLI